MRKWPVIKVMSMMSVCAISLSMFAGALSLTNNSPYDAEIGGLVNATASKQVLSANGGTSVVRSKGDFAGHVLLKSDTKLVDNIVFKSVNDQLKAVDLNKHARITAGSGQLIVN